MSPPNENVLVVRRSLFDELGSFQGLNFEPQKYLDALLSRGNNFFLPREQAENDPMHKSGARKFRVRPWLINEGSVTVRINFSDCGGQLS